MKKGWFIVIVCVLFAVGIAIYFAPSFMTTNTAIADPPFKPSKVPDDAFWAGGVDGGHFITISKNKSQVNTYKVSIYTDYTGDLDFVGILQYQGKENIDKKITNNSFVRYWDGNVLHLANGAFMKILQENPLP